MGVLAELCFVGDGVFMAALLVDRGGVDGAADDAMAGGGFGAVPFTTRRIRRDVWEGCVAFVWVILSKSTL